MHLHTFFFSSEDKLSYYSMSRVYVLYISQTSTFTFDSWGCVFVYSLNSMREAKASDN